MTTPSQQNTLVHEMKMLAVQPSVRPLSSTLELQNVSTRSRGMITCYPGNGTFYSKHVDNPICNGRKLTTIYYTNKEWVASDGGCLRIHPPHNGAKRDNSSDGTESCVVDDFLDILPSFNRLVLFWSDGRCPHEVRPCLRPRFAITAWFIDALEKRAAFEAEEGRRGTNGQSPSESPSLSSEIAGMSTVGAGVNDDVRDGNKEEAEENPSVKSEYTANVGVDPMQSNQLPSHAPAPTPIPILTPSVAQEAGPTAHASTPTWETTEVRDGANRTLRVVVHFGATVIAGASSVELEVRGDCIRMSPASSPSSPPLSPRPSGAPAAAFQACTVPLECAIDCSTASASFSRKKNCLTVVAAVVGPPPEPLLQWGSV